MAHEPLPPGQSRLATTPVVSLIALGLFLVAAIVLISFDNQNERGGHIVLLLGVLVLGLQSGIAAVFAERSARHNQNLLTNGIVEKAAQGARQAIREEQVNGPVVPTELDALKEILDEVRMNRAAIQQKLPGPADGESQ